MPSAFSSAVLYKNAEFLEQLNHSGFLSSEQLTGLIVLVTYYYKYRCELKIRQFQNLRMSDVIAITARILKLGKLFELTISVFFIAETTLEFDPRS